MCSKAKAKELFPYFVITLLWSVWRQHGADLLPLGSGAALAEALVIKNVIWLLPLGPVMRREKDNWFIKPQELFGEPFPWLPCVAMVCASAAFLHTVRIIVGNIRTIALFDPVFVILSLCAGVTEEVVFRGYFFNRQACGLGVFPAAVLNGVLFALIHYPGLLWGQGWDLLFSWRTVLIFVMGTLFCLAFARWKNLALTVIVHTVWNILSYWFGLAG